MEAAFWASVICIVGVTKMGPMAFAERVCIGQIPVDNNGEFCGCNFVPEFFRTGYSGNFSIQNNSRRDRQMVNLGGLNEFEYVLSMRLWSIWAEIKSIATEWQESADCMNLDHMSWSSPVISDRGWALEYGSPAILTKLLGPIEIWKCDSNPGSLFLAGVINNGLKHGPVLPFTGFNTLLRDFLRPIHRSRLPVDIADCAPHLFCGLFATSLHLSESAAHHVELAPIDGRRNNANDHKAHLSGNVQFFKPMQFSGDLRGVISIALSVVCLSCRWYSILWGHPGAFGSREQRLRGVISALGLIGFVGHRCDRVYSRLECSAIAPTAPWTHRRKHQAA